MSRSRRRGRRMPLLSLVGLALVCVLVGGAGLESTAFSAASAPREATVDVTIDENGVHSLDTAQSVHVNSTEALTNVTNNHAQDVTVTVALRDDSTQKGDLVVNGVTEGNSATFTLRKTEAETVKIRVPDDGTLAGQTVYFHVNASAPGFRVDATGRSSPIEK